jgi:hypothetical protein
VVTKAIVQSINRAGNRCIIRVPLFETASSSAPIELEAILSITPGLFNNIFVNDVVIIAFEENALEKPIILGKLYTGAQNESNTHGGAAILDMVNVKASATLPAATTTFSFEGENIAEYSDVNTPKKQADYIKWLEKFFKNTATTADSNFKCLKNWTQWQLQPENVEIDDGDIDENDAIIAPLLYQAECSECKICGAGCLKEETRRYTTLDTTKKYPDI